MQDASGAFGVWGPRNGDIWLTSYVTDFLTRAKESGYTIKPQALAQALDRLQSYVSYAEDFERGGEARAYALYVLARNGRAPIGELRYYVDDRLERFATPLAQAQLGAALAMLGDKERAEKAFRMALKNMGATDAGTARLDYGTTLRDGAALLSLVSETKVVRGETPRLASVVAAAYSTRTYTSTQEQAWMVLAAKALIDETRETNLTVNGTSHKGQLNQAITPAELQGGAVAISNDGATPVDAVVSVIGASLTPEPAIAKGFKIERTYYTLDGKQIDLKSSAGGTGELKRDGPTGGRAEDRGHAGGRARAAGRSSAGRARNREPAPHRQREPEELRLPERQHQARAHGVSRRPLRGRLQLLRQDPRAGCRTSGGQRRRQRQLGHERSSGATQGPDQLGNRGLHGARRDAGSFVHPAATVEDMYRPDRFARTAAGRLQVMAKE